jgi:undecaprenyl-diphosphatase
MLEMPARRFLLFNVISGLLWAPVYVLPGMIFTTSLGLAAEVASRWAVLAGSMMAVLVLLLWLSRLSFNWLHRRTYPLMQRLLWWSQFHPVVGRIPASLLDPAQPEARGLTLLALLLLCATVLFSAIIGTLGESGGLLTGLDDTLQQMLHQLRTPAMDRLMILFSQLGDSEILLTLSLLVLLWLLRCGLKRAALHWLAAVGFGSLLGLALYALGTQLHAEALTRHATDNSLLLSAIACFGFLAVLITRELPLRHRWSVYALTGTLLLAIAFSRLYLGIQHLTAILGVLALGVAWVSLLGIGYHNHPAGRVAPHHLSLLALLTITLSMAWHSPQQFAEALQRHGYTEESVELSAQQWQEGTTPLIPRFRADLRGRHQHPLDLQYAGELAALEKSLRDAGWHRPPPLDAISWLVWLNPNTPLAEMPVLPQVHEGRHHELLLTREVNGSMLALRLWRTPYIIRETQQAVWAGNVTQLKAETHGGLTAPRTQPDFTEALGAFIQMLQGLPGITLYPPAQGQNLVRFSLRAG